MTIQIGYVGCKGADSRALGESLRPLLPGGCTLNLLTAAEAMEHAGMGNVTILVAAFDSSTWRENMAAIAELHATGKIRATVALALVPRDDPEALVKAFDIGAADVAYLPIDPHEFRSRLAVLVRRRMVAAARAAEMRAAWRLAVLDPVTGLYNRQHLETVLPAAISSARTFQRPLALLMVDLDALKPFNDRWGHAAGDRMLRGVADVLTANLRTTDTIARIGGDEMAVIMPDTDVATARQIASRLVTAIGRLKLGKNGDTVAAITVSIGMTTLNASWDDAETLLSRADSALYRAKSQGRNRVAEAA